MPVVPLEIATADETLVARLAGVQGMAGAGREVNSGVGTPNVAAVAANWLWSQLHGHAAQLHVAGAEVPLHHAAIKAALLEAAAEPLPL